MLFFHNLQLVYLGLIIHHKRCVKPKDIQTPHNDKQTDIYIEVQIESELGYSWNETKFQTEKQEGTLNQCIDDEFNVELVYSSTYVFTLAVERLNDED